MKRTKRYGGFRIGDRVRTKHDYNIGNGEVVGMRDGYLLVKFIVLGNGIMEFAVMPNRLINLTRIEEEREAEIKERLKRMGFENWKTEDYDIMPPNTPFPISPENMFKSCKDIEDKIKKIGDEIYSTKLELDRLKVRDCIQYKEWDINRIVARDLSSPYTRDVYSCTLNY